MFHAKIIFFKIEPYMDPYKPQKNRWKKGPNGEKIFWGTGVHKGVHF